MNWLTHFCKDRVSASGFSLYWLAAACLLLGPWSHVGMDVFALNRPELQDGEFWRLWTGQLVHTSWAHIALNLVGLAVLQQLFGTELALPVWAWGFAVISLCIGICWLAFDDVSWLPFASREFVVGMSALLHGLFALAACLAMRRDTLLAAAALVVIGGKVVWEQLNGPSELTAQMIGMPVASDAHLYGYVSGLLLGIAMTARHAHTTGGSRG